MSGAVIGIQQLIGGLPNLVQIIIVAIVGAVVFAASSFVMKINAFLFLLNNIRKRGKNSEA